MTQSTKGPSAAKKWLVTLGRDADRAVPVRDYFLRLGIPARLRSPLEIELQTTADVAELEEYIQSWEAANGPRLELRGAEVVPVPAAPHFDVTLFRPPRLGELLRRMGLIDEEQLERALACSQDSGRLLGLVLVESGVLFEEDLARTLAAQLDLPYISIGRVGVNLATVNLLPSSLGRELAAIPVRPKGNDVLVAFADPTDPDALAEVRRYLPRFELAISELSEILNAWRLVERPRNVQDAALRA